MRKILITLLLLMVQNSYANTNNQTKYCKNEIANLIVIEIKKKQPILKNWNPSEKSCQAIVDVSAEITTQLLQKGQLIDIQKLINKQPT